MELNGKAWSSCRKWRESCSAKFFLSLHLMQFNENWCAYCRWEVAGSSSFWTTKGSIFFFGFFPSRARPLVPSQDFLLLISALFSCLHVTWDRWQDKTALEWEVSGAVHLCAVPALWVGLVSFCKHESMKPRASIMREESVRKPMLNGKDWRYRGQLQSLWLCTSEILSVSALPAWVSSSASFHRGAIQWRWRVSWQHVPSFLNCSGLSHAMNSSHSDCRGACLSLSEHVDGKGKVLKAWEQLDKDLWLEFWWVTFVCSWWSGIP